VLIITWKALALHAAFQSTSSTRLVCALNLRVHDVVLLDEVHLLPAETHKRALGSLRIGSVIGMTAEPVRCDGRHSELLQEVGNVLYRMTLDQSCEGGITVEVERTMMCVHTDEELLTAYEASPNAEERRLIALFNPQKMCALDALLREESGKKVIVYCDKLKAIETIERVLTTLGDAHGIPFLGTLSGEKSASHRRALCDSLRLCATYACREHIHRRDRHRLRDRARRM
jgi:DNA excision repair protein ERCC-3